MDELRSSQRFLQEFKPVGFRAPEARLDESCVKMLASYGFQYDSSSYGLLKTSRFVDSVLEIPVSTFRFRRVSNPSTLPRNISKLLLTKELPFGSGFFLSAMGRFGSLVPELLQMQNEVPVMFVHPWQIQPYLSHGSHTSVTSRSIAMQLYSKKCDHSLVRILKHFETVRLCDLARRLNEQS